MPSPSPILVATLGGKAQVVTFALDALHARTIFPETIVLFHHAPPEPEQRLRRALAQLERTFGGGRYGARPCRLHPVPLRDSQGRPLYELDDDNAVAGAWATIRATLVELKQRPQPVHLCLTGGRRLMALLATSLAPLLFDHQDRFWHLYTPADLRHAAGEGELLHAPPDGPQPHLISIPLMPWGQYVPGLQAAAQASPAAVRAARQATLPPEELGRCAQLFDALAPRQQQVLEGFARGESPTQLAQRLHLAPSTISTYSRAIYDLCRTTWPEQQGRWDYRAVALRFRGYFADPS